MCSGDGVCLPPLSTPPLLGTCIYRPGDVACPPGKYLSKRLYFDGVADDRSCTSCECGTPTGRVCSVRIRGFENQQCAPAVIDVTIQTNVPGPGCVVGPNAKYFKQSAAVILDKGACMAKSGTPIGAAAPKGPTTVCCDR